MSEYKLFFGDAHTNLHSPKMRQPGYLQAVLQHAREMLDFWPIAYYPQEYREVQGFRFEDKLDDQTIQQDWKVICDLAAENNIPGEFVAFAGYEWQGNGRWGDHNVFFLHDHQPILLPDTTPELFRQLRELGTKVIAIPHHPAYITGVRGKNWDVHDEELSPFVEIYSVHGCSESDEGPIGLRTNPHMGPELSGGTLEDALNRGYRIGIIASGDNHVWPAVYGNGLMACWATALTREALWEAFKQRRVYGVSADRIALEFTVEDAPMGSILAHTGPVHIRIRVVGSDAIDRIELLRNNRLIACYCHQGQWDVPENDELIRFKLRIEAGWGPREDEMPERVQRQWSCSLQVDEGVIVGVEKCWLSPGQHVDKPGGNRCDFGFTTRLGAGGQRAFGFRGYAVRGQATVFEIEAHPSDTIHLDLDGWKCSMSVAEAMRESRVAYFPEEVRQYIRERHGLDPDRLPRPDPFYFLSHKAKVHRAIPECGYTAEFTYTDENPPKGTNHYRVRVHQRNGAIAWSSPIWVES